MSKNQLNGELPDLSSFPQLKTLWAFYNLHLIGSIFYCAHVKCSMLYGSIPNDSVYEISSQDCHIICWSQNNCKVLEITISEWLVITLLNIKYLDFVFNGEILRSCISHQWVYNLSKPKYIHILEKTMLMIGFFNIMVQLARLKFLGLTL